MVPVEVGTGSNGGLRAVSDVALELGEGARWVDGRLVLVDILVGRLYSHPGTEPGPMTLLAETEVPLGAVAPVAGRPGAWVAAAGDGIALLSGTGTLEWLDRPEERQRGATRMNDGVCDPAGRFWAGSMAYDAASPLGSLYRVDLDGSVVRVLDGIAICNGPAFSADGAIMHVADSAAGTVTRYRVSPAGDLDAGERVLRFGPGQGAPDGMVMDGDGHLWVACHGAGMVRRYDPSAIVVAEVRVPTPQPTSVCLAAGHLIVTTAWEGLDPRPAGAGLLYATALDVPGIAQPAAAAYGG
jgi:sugar lactone lactonase YvrE